MHNHDLILPTIQAVYENIYVQGDRHSVIKNALLDTFVAGGAVRDYLLGKPVSDIDIYIPRSNTMHNWKAEDGSILYAAGFVPFADLTGSEYAPGTIDRVVESRGGAYPLKVQLVSHKADSVRDILRTFPVSICRVMWSPQDSKIKSTAMFKASVCDKTIRYNPHGKVLYIQKIYKKYHPSEGWNWNAVRGL